MPLHRLIVLAALAGQLIAADRFFVQLSDPQLGMNADNADFSQETANFEFAIATCNRLRPAFVVVCGDLVNRTGDAAQIAEYHRIAKKLDPSIPLYNVAGNHDLGNEPTPESLAAYRAKFGPDYYVFRQGDLAGVILDSSLIQHPDKAPRQAAEQEAWLKSQLQRLKSEGARIVLFQHISFFLERPDEPDQYFNIPLAIRRKYLALLSEYGVVNVFAGHYHRNASGMAGPLAMVTTGPVSKPLGPDPAGIRIVAIRESSMPSQYFGFGNIPNRVDLSVMK